MSNKEILFTIPADIKFVVHDYMQAYLRERGYALKALYSDTPLGAEDMIRELEGISGYIVGHDEVSRTVLEAARDLKAVSKFGVGIDNIDTIAAAEHGVEVSNCPDSNSNAVAELTISLMISIARNTQKMCEDMRSGKWCVSIGNELAGKRVGILGFGNIGRKVATYLKPFTSDILVYGSSVKKELEAEYGVRYASLEEIAATADFISLHLPRIPATENLINAEVFSKMKRGVYLVNVARGGVVNEDALFDAVERGIVTRAALDVFDVEPNTTSKLLKDDRFIVLPHIGAASVEATYNMARMAMDNVIAVLEGRPNPHPVRK